LSAGGAARNDVSASKTLPIKADLCGFFATRLKFSRSAAPTALGRNSVHPDLAGLG
jgi:hypothetical protein